MYWQPIFVFTFTSLKEAVCDVVKDVGTSAPLFGQTIVVGPEEKLILYRIKCSVTVLSLCASNPHCPSAYSNVVYRVIVL